MTQDEHTRIDDTAFAERALAALPEVEVPSAMRARILGDFDAVAARRRGGSPLRHLIDALWPGLPVWQPAAALALSLMLGLTAGALMPKAGAVDAGAQTETQVSDTSPALDMLGDL